VKYAEAYGARGIRVQSTAELLPALSRALEQGGVQLVCVPVDYSENQRVLVDELARLA
jgi:acetolactate synthase-1/2/3 large subunit